MDYMGDSTATISRSATTDRHDFGWRLAMATWLINHHDLLSLLSFEGITIFPGTHTHVMLEEFVPWFNPNH